jgi:uncharacterized protein with GYD domain
LRRPCACAPIANGRWQLIPKYVTLYNWTDQGVTRAKETVSRSQAAKQLVESKRGTVDAVLWTLGPYDLVSIGDIPDDATGAAINLQLASAGGVRTLSMRAFTEDEMNAIIAQVG